MIDVVARLQAALAGHYRIERELGAGGMATVFLAHDLKHQRQVAGIGIPIEDAEVWRDAACRVTTSGAVRAGSFANLPASRALRSAPPRVVARWHRTDLGPRRAPTVPDQ